MTDPRDVQRIDRELAARRARYMKELRPAIVALEKRINDIVHERRALWQRLEAAFNERMLARHDAETAGDRSSSDASRVDTISSLCRMPGLSNEK